MKSELKCGEGEKCRVREKCGVWSVECGVDADARLQILSKDENLYGGNITRKRNSTLHTPHSTLLLLFLLLLFLLAPFSFAFPVTVQPLEGEAYSVELIGFEGKNVLFDSKSFPTSSLKSIQFQRTSSASEPKPEAKLVVTLGESTLRAESLTFSKNQFQIQPTVGGNSEPLEAGTVQQILFRESELGQNVDLDADWAEIQSMELSGDQLVVLRDGKLSHYFGTVLEITEKTVRFEQDGEALNVKRKYIFAIRFAPLTNEEKVDVESPFLGLLTDAAGSTFAISALVPDGQNARITLTSRQKLMFPVSALVKLDFTSGRTVSLASLKAESLEVTPFFGMENAPESLQKFSTPQINRGFGGGKIRLGGLEFTEGIELSSRTRMVFRLPGTFQTFRTTVGIDDSVRPGGNAEVSILADEKVLFNEKLTGKDEPKSLNLNISGVHRIILLVDFGEGGSLGDYVGFGDAILEK